MVYNDTMMYDGIDYWSIDGDVFDSLSDSVSPVDRVVLGSSLDDYFERLAALERAK